jgi:hypothetical protein
MKQFVLLAGLLIVGFGIVHAEDWNVKGRIYHNVQVQGSDDAYVSIMYDGGIGRVALADLPPEVQKRFNYDSAKSKAALDAEASRVAASDQMASVQMAKDNAAAQQQSTPASAPSPSSAPPRQPSSHAAEIAQLRAQIAALNQAADAADAPPTAAYNSSVYTSQNGQLEHRYTRGHSQEASDDRAKAAQFQRQLDVLLASGG